MFQESQEADQRKKYLTHLWETKMDANVNFNVGFPDSEKRICVAHKFVLCMGSSVFYDMPIMNNTNEANIEINDIAPDDFDILLKFLYQLPVVDDISIENSFAVYHATKKYEIKELKQFCFNYLLKNINENVVLKMINYANLYSEFELYEHCLRIIELNVESVLTNDRDGFYEMDSNLLIKLFRRNTFYADEYFLFQSINEWAIEACRRQKIQPTSRNKRRLLGELIYCIRIPLINYDIFFKKIRMFSIRF